ncbi:cyclic nucleotide-binding domain-containing protein, partial [Guyparkeria sp. 1SP6A2]|nr:cyclic nucleotide-binding domain-containing protein [Guyparkeria sp. 1SP6A2]
MSYFKTGSDILELDATLDELCYIRSGAVEVYRRQGELYNRLSEGDIFGHFSLLRNHKVRFPAKAIEDTLIYFIPNDVFQRLCEEDDEFADFVELERPRLETAAEQQKKSNDMMVTRIRKLVTRYPVMVESTTSVQQAAQQISAAQASAVLVIDEGSNHP